MLLPLVHVGDELMLLPLVHVGDGLILLPLVHVGDGLMSLPLTLTPFSGSPNDSTDTPIPPEPPFSFLQDGQSGRFDYGRRIGLESGDELGVFLRHDIE